MWNTIDNELEKEIIHTVPVGQKIVWILVWDLLGKIPHLPISVHLIHCRNLVFDLSRLAPLFNYLDSLIFMLNFIKHSRSS